jgi:flagellar biosynthesis/type III secretory pathway chaperone
MDKNMLEKFSGHLNESLTLLNELKDMAENEKKALIKCDYSNLDKVLKDRDLVLTRFQETIKELERIFPIIADSENGGIKSLAELSQYIDEPYSSLFRSFPDEFHGLVKTIHEANLRNLIVLNHCKELVYGFLCTVAKKVQPTETYTPYGKINKPTPPSFITSNF